MAERERNAQASIPLAMNPFVRPWYIWNNNALSARILFFHPFFQISRAILCIEFQRVERMTTVPVLKVSWISARGSRSINEHDLADDWLIRCLWGNHAFDYQNLLPLDFNAKA